MEAKNGRQLIINSSLYKSTSDPGSLWQRVFKNITALAEVVWHSALCCNCERIWRPQRAIQSNNYRCTVKVSSSKTVRATNHHFHLSRSSPNTMKNKPPMAFLSHGTRAHICVACRHSPLCKPVHVFWSSSTQKKKKNNPKKPVCFVWGCSAPLEMCLGICLSHLRQRFLQERTCGGGPGCFKVCLFDKLWIKCRDGCSKRRSYLRSWLWHCCVWKTEDATREKSQTKRRICIRQGEHCGVLQSSRVLNL